MVRWQTTLAPDNHCSLFEKIATSLTEKFSVSTIENVPLLVDGCEESKSLRINFDIRFSSKHFRLPGTSERGCGLFKKPTKT